MYDELINNLRSVQDDWQTEDETWMLRAADAIEELQIIVDSYRKRMWAGLDWVPVSERLPKDGVYVLGRYANNDMAVVCVFEHDEDLVFWRAMVDEGWETDCDIEPTHWTPLPKPPKEEAT